MRGSTCESVKGLEAERGDGNGKLTRKFVSMDESVAARDGLV